MNWISEHEIILWNLYSNRIRTIQSIGQLKVYYSFKNGFWTKSIQIVKYIQIKYIQIVTLLSTSLAFLHSIDNFKWVRNLQNWKSHRKKWKWFSGVVNLAKKPGVCQARPNSLTNTEWTLRVFDIFRTNSQKNPFYLVDFN